MSRRSKRMRKRLKKGWRHTPEARSGDSSGSSIRQMVPGIAYRGGAGELYRALTMVAHHHAMKTRDNMSAVIKGLQRDHGLLAAYLEATDRIDWQALNRRVMIGEPPKPSNVEAHQASSTAAPSTTSMFVLRRANLERVP
jgi:hypothetical protein